MVRVRVKGLGSREGDAVDASLFCSFGVNQENFL